MTTNNSKDLPTGIFQFKQTTRLFKVIYSSLGCETTGGDDDFAVSNLPCVFPFKWNGTTYNGCTEDDNSKGHAWCMTDHDDMHWGFCNDKCPLDKINNWGKCQDDCQLHHDVAGKKYT